MIRFIFIALIIYSVYRLWKRAGQRHRSEAPKAVSAGEMVACSRCGTFILTSEAVHEDDRVFCSEGCLHGN